MEGEIEKLIKESNEILNQTYSIMQKAIKDSEKITETADNFKNKLENITKQSKLIEEHEPVTIINKIKNLINVYETNIKLKREDLDQISDSQEPIIVHEILIKIENYLEFIKFLKEIIN